jgi:hypothetical protein
MSYYKIALLIVVLLNMSGYSQLHKYTKVTEINLSTFNDKYKELDTKDALPFSFLPQDVAIGLDDDIYIVNRRNLEIIKIDKNQAINVLSIDEDSLISSAISSGLISYNSNSLFNLKIAADKNENLFVMILWGEIMKKIIKYDRYFNKDEKFVLQQPYPDQYIREFLINANNELLLRVFPYAPVGYEEEIKKGLVYLYNNDGTYIGRSDQSNTDFERIKKIRKEILYANGSQNNILITDDVPFIKSNANGDIFIYGIKSYDDNKLDRNKKYYAKDLRLEIKKLENNDREIK